jgi:hypothetical protein
MSLDYNTLEPGIRDLCRAFNESGVAETVWSCDGHRWKGLLSGDRDHRPYIIFDAPGDFAAQLNDRLWAAGGGRGGHRLYLGWDIQGVFLVDEPPRPAMWRLRWRLDCSTLYGRRWWHDGRVGLDLAEIGAIVTELRHLRADGRDAGISVPVGRDNLRYAICADEAVTE